MRSTHSKIYVAFRPLFSLSILDSYRPDDETQYIILFDYFEIITKDYTAIFVQKFFNNNTF
jgi:hypothetical protein